MFTHKSLVHQTKSRTPIFKYLTMFFLGASAVLLMTQAFNISTSLNNAVQYIGQIVLTTDGSATADTGIILDGSDGNAFFSGNVGIGTDAPLTQLEVVGASGYVSAHNGFDVFGYSYSSLFLNGNSSSYSGLQLMHYLGGAAITNWDTGSLYLGTSGTTMVTVNSSGNVGIGTTTPSQALEVSGNIALSTSGRIGATSNQVYMGTNGRVGIGTNVPGATLHVNGSGKFLTSIQVGDARGQGDPNVNDRCSTTGDAGKISYETACLYSARFYVFMGCIHDGANSVTTQILMTGYNTLVGCTPPIP